MGDRVRVVQPGADGDQRAAIVPGEREPVVPERVGERDHVGGHGALGIGQPGRVGRFAAVPVTAEVGAEHGVVRGEVGGHVPPHQVGLGKPCSSTIGLPEPPTATLSATPSATVTRW